MSSVEIYVLRIKPALEAFLRSPSKSNLTTLENELMKSNWTYINLFDAQVLIPLILKLDDLSNGDQDLRTACMECIAMVMSKTYLKQFSAIRTILVVTLKQLRHWPEISIRSNLSEEIKLAATKCIIVCLKRSLSDVLEQFYTKECVVILGQILLTLLEIIEYEKYKHLIIAALECLMVVFYVHDDADKMDVVMRNQVANTIFVFLPKVVTVLYKITLGDEKLNEIIKVISLKALGRILNIIFEETSENLINVRHDATAFKQLLATALSSEIDGKSSTPNKLGSKNDSARLEMQIKELQGEGRSQAWIHMSSSKLHVIFTKMSILRSHTSTSIRKEYANMCCLLIRNCAHNLKDNFIIILESILALTEDSDSSIRNLCKQTIAQIQNTYGIKELFDEKAEYLLETHLTKLPRIISRRDDNEQFAELSFIKGFFKSLEPERLCSVLTVSRHMEIFCACLLEALALQTSFNFLKAENEYILNHIRSNSDYENCSTLPWRRFKNLTTMRCVNIMQDICGLLGRTEILNQLLMDYLMEMLIQYNSAASNEILLIILWLGTIEEKSVEDNNLNLVSQLMEELLDNRHWYLALKPDNVEHIQSAKSTNWIVERTPGLYESGIEIRTQSIDSDDESQETSTQTVTANDAVYNVLHTCIVLDAVGHCALKLGEKFNVYMFRSLHKILIKIGDQNVMVAEAALFSLTSIQKALKFNDLTLLIESHIDYLGYHLNVALKQTPNNEAAIDIITVLFHFSSQNSIPYLENIFKIIYEQFCDLQNKVYCNAYLKVFKAFLYYIKKWLLDCDLEIAKNVEIPISNEAEEENEENILKHWLDTLSNISSTDILMDSENCNLNDDDDDNNNKCQPNVNAIYDTSNDNYIPNYLEMIKTILYQAVKCLTTNEHIYQILSLDCLVIGIPLLRDYENILLPLVHYLWMPLMEKFRQRNLIIMIRCLSVLAVLADCAKDFITKRTLDEVVPFLETFLQNSVDKSIKFHGASTQTYKLQVKLLEELANLIVSLNIDGRHLNKISEIVSLYLSNEQCPSLQNAAVGYFRKLRFYNGPMIYLILLKKLHLKNYHKNIANIFNEFGLS